MTSDDNRAAEDFALNHSGKLELTHEARLNIHQMCLYHGFRAGARWQRERSGGVVVHDMMCFNLEHGGLVEERDRQAELLRVAESALEKIASQPTVHPLAVFSRRVATEALAKLRGEGGK